MRLKTLSMQLPFRLILYFSKLAALLILFHSICVTFIEFVLWVYLLNYSSTQYKFDNQVPDYINYTAFRYK